jgi:uncharacterized protein YehS (DUF1456 family)
MIHNDVLRSVRYMLDVDEAALVAILRLGGGEASSAELRTYLLREDEPGFVVCPEGVMARFLDGLVVHRRGRDESAPPRPPEPSVTNNVVLKKLRVAFQLKEDDLLNMLRVAGFAVSKPELSALFRAPGHPNYRACGDQFLRNFLKGLTARIRPA